MKYRAEVIDLSASTRAVVSFKASGRVQAVTFLRGSSAFTIMDSEARKLAAALAEAKAEE